MPGNLFDVFVVGSNDPSAAGETRLAAALSAKHGLPLATVAKAIAAKNLRAGQGLDQAQAQALVRHLQSIGAVTVIRPAATRTQTGHVSSPSQVSNVPGAQVAPQPTPPSPGRPLTVTPAPGAGWPGAPAEPGLSSTRFQFAPLGGSQVGGQAILSNAASDPFAPLSPPADSAPPGAPDPFQPKRGLTPVLGVPVRPRTVPTPAPPPPINATPIPQSGLALDGTSAGRLQLARGDQGESEDELAAVRGRPSGSAASLREMGMAANSGVAMDEDHKNLNLVRCVQHGLYYDKTKASGCRKCMSSAREMANKLESRAEPFRVGNLRRSPSKRAFLGLAFSLVLGFLPAVYYCFGPGATEVRRIRVEQELLSRQPGTEEIMRRFDELDGQVGDLHNRSTRNTAVLWFAVASVGMLGWYKIT